MENKIFDRGWVVENQDTLHHIDLRTCKVKFKTSSAARIKSKSEIRKELFENLKDSIGEDFIINKELQNLIKVATETMTECKRGIIIQGNTGTGKTKFLEVCVKWFNDNSRFNYSYFPRKALKIIDDEIKLEYGYNVYFGDLITFIDDLGSEPKFTYFGKTITPLEDLIMDLYDFYSNRYGFLFITTNLDNEGIINKYGDRFYSRLCEICTFVNLSGLDLRK